MAKELPYFKFFVSEWSDGDITLEDYAVQGVFINVCSYYWSNGCDVTYSKLIKKFKDCGVSIDVLENESIIKIEGGMVFINFLDEQLEDRKQTSNQNSKAGKASAEKRRLAKLEQEVNENSTPDENTLNGNSTIKKREEKKRRDKSKGGGVEDQKKKFIIWFNDQKNIYTGSKGKFQVLSGTDENNLKKLLENYDSNDFKIAIPNLYKSEWAKNNNGFTPTHFLRVDNFNKYLNQSTSYDSERPEIDKLVANMALQYKDQMDGLLSKGWTVEEITKIANS